MRSDALELTLRGKAGQHLSGQLQYFKSGQWINVDVTLRYASASPYSLTAGEDIFHTGLSNARPAGVGRNTLRGSDLQSIDLRWSHETQVAKGKDVTFGIDAFNVFNHPNFTNYVGNVRSPLYGSPTNVSPSRRIQLSAEATF